MRFNAYIRNHFAGCRLISKARDDHRNRDVEIYAIPGFYEDVGVTDGVDAWIAPVSAGPFFRTATGDLREQLLALKEGRPIAQVAEAAPKAKRIPLDDDLPQRPAKTAQADPQPRRTRHAFV